MASINPAQIAAWLKLGETVIGSDLVQRFLGQIGTSLKLTPEQMAVVEANIKDYDARIARAEKASNRLRDDADDDGA